ncbi:hypothetical protein ABFP89_00855 [Clostridioides difficile]|nr:hypothetical protein [Clostridioides difficile]EQJ75095.1 putative peptidoglycan-binding/hydrolysing protein [Clostridioides difficile P42]EQK84187.1 putative peptidoglycan-binding/hydrolysing protein [Clostridioides difficile P30]MCR8740094.1 hypothetical protein [Clostridioides difficile]MDL0173755.1 hypothetical protein [Clostridioides difficile]MDU1166053.1 hypothetical protein [Clostridioides difficile]
MIVNLDPLHIMQLSHFKGRLGLTRDGIVGRNTWDVAGRRL